MQQYIIRRILFFIPSLIIITIIAFAISAYAPGDPVSRLMGGETERPERREFFRERYLHLQRQLGLDLPLFYVSVKPKALNADFNSVFNERHRNALKKLSAETGNAHAVLAYYHLASSFAENNAGNAALLVRNALNHSDPDEIDIIYKSLSMEERAFAAGVTEAWNEVKVSGSRWDKFLPVVNFHFPNRYHRWVFGDGHWLTGQGAVHSKGIIRGDFGRSYVSGKGAGTILSEKIGWTVFFSVAGLLLAFIISIPTGVKAGSRQGGIFDRFSNGILMTLHSLPSFFIASCLLMIFANPAMLHWFPASGIAPVMSNTTSSWMERIWVHLPYVVLPLSAFVIGTLPFFARTVRSSMIEERGKDYIVTAKAKGVKEAAINWKHAFRNSLLPLITILGYVFPAVVGGSAILETVFSIPGMGLEIVNAIYNRDYPVIIAVFTLSGVLTITGLLISDVLYAYADPRIRLA